MKLTCNREHLQNCLSTVSKAATTRTTMPILECILIEAGDDGFMLTANDLEIGIQTKKIEAQILETGGVCLDAKLFQDIIRRIVDDEITIITNKNNQTTISTKNLEYKIAGLPADEYPTLPQLETDMGNEIIQSGFKNMIKQVIFAVSSDEARPAFTGILLEVRDNFLKLTAVDGFRISFRQTEIAQTTQNISVIVPSKTMHELARILKNDEMATIYTTDRHILFDLGYCVLISRLIEGDFLKYESMFTDDYETIIKVSKDEFQNCLERASLIATETRKTPIKLQINEDKVVITSQTEVGTAYEELKAQMNGVELEISFNPRYLIEPLKSISDEIVSVQFTSSLSPCIIKPMQNPANTKYLVLPLRSK